MFLKKPLRCRPAVRVGSCKAFVADYSASKLQRSTLISPINNGLIRSPAPACSSTAVSSGANFWRVPRPGVESGIATHEFSVTQSVANWEYQIECAFQVWSDCLPSSLCSLACIKNKLVQGSNSRSCPLNAYNLPSFWTLEASPLETYPRLKLACFVDCFKSGAHLSGPRALYISDPGSLTPMFARTYPKRFTSNRRPFSQSY